MLEVEAATLSAEKEKPAKSIASPHATPIEAKKQSSADHMAPQVIQQETMKPTNAAIALKATAETQEKTNVEREETSPNKTLKQKLAAEMQITNTKKPKISYTKDMALDISMASPKEVTAKSSKETTTEPS
ncbi:hypothetical protein QVD17_30824 [Tagetes erecta]|uniref:Uncharacterized protein n=1 Tax=Tagetes erecta TaxID=13708 RepID=A0AAD8NML4_TARER|nr:hypothetical protein QVD17_30824 [Tagetes erecta]